MWKIAKEYIHHLFKLNLEKGMFTFEKLQQFGYFKILKESLLIEFFEYEQLNQVKL